MPDHSIPVAVARAFTEAWTSRDFDLAASYVAEDAIFDGPLGHADGKQEYMQGISGLARIVTGLRILAAYGDDTRALIMYELTTESFGVLTCAKLLSVRDGKIQTDRLTFDSHEIKKARGD
ncbi:MAG TPA: nuclear transport factor 2 family protein [Ktedonobacterales bacterium]|nr:nuclear transport factor 2 family protein [Ktedonobacterales bacterium]